jgi:hypothetical protein
MARLVLPMERSIERQATSGSAALAREKKMPLIGGVVLLIQFCFAYHALKTGRPYWWIFVIMAFPVAGCIIYYFVEVFPGSREQRSANSAARKLARVLEPDADLNKRVEELEICGSVDNKLALAAECMNHQMYPEAARLYASCLDAVYASDGAILFGLAQALVEGGDWGKASAAVERLKSNAPKFRPLEVQLLQARALEGRGDKDAALSAYRELIPVFVGLEARYRYGSFLSRLGKHDAAMEVFNDVVKCAKRFSSSLEEEERWASAAKRAIAGG